MYPDWINILEQFVAKRIKAFFDKGEPVLAPPSFPLKKDLPDITGQSFNDEETLILLLALAPHVQPVLYHNILTTNIEGGGQHPQFGFGRGQAHRGFLPTGETALYLLAGNDFAKRLKVQQLFSEEHFFAKKRILWLDDVPEGEPRMSGRIVLSQEYVELLTLKKVSRPKFGIRFPAQLLETAMEWSDLVLNATTRKQIEELSAWVTHGQTLMDGWEMGKKLKPGYRALFYGPPGTGKTLTASLLGKSTGKEVFKVDLSMVVSKFIGETEKNLANLFAKAENKSWILFFDEADALFGKRTNVRDAHDKYANQEVSYLLQRIENYNGLVILASNYKSNMDEAFVRRFQSIVYFPMPNGRERLQIWEKAFPKKANLHRNVGLPVLAQKYELSGAEIMNVVQHCCFGALANGTSTICQADLLRGIEREFQKEGKIMR